MTESFVSNTFNALIGEWTIQRQISPGGVYAGRAIFMQHAEGNLLYKEHGVLTLDNGTVLEPTKQYQWQIEQGAIAIYFDDGPTKGTHFQTLNFSDSKAAQAKHFCAPDDYVSAYTFNMPDHFEITHNVSGPKKSYISHSVYRRICS